MKNLAPYYSEIAEGPEGGTAYWVSTVDAVRLRLGLWRAKNASKGTILILPGRTEYIELYGHTASDLVAHGYDVLTLDWRGHGLSDRLTGDPSIIHIDRFTDYQKDISCLTKAVEDLDVSQPLFLLGNSMGGCIGLRALLEGLKVNACAFTSPMWRIKMTKFQRLIAPTISWGAQFFGQGTAYIPGQNSKNYASHNPFEGNRITSDLAQYKYWVRQVQGRPAFQSGGSSLRWLQQSLLECRRLKKHHSPNIPCIAFCGSEDQVIESSSVETRLFAWSEGEFMRVEGARHALLLERDSVRENVIGQIVDHFSKHR